MASTWPQRSFSARVPIGATPFCSPRAYHRSPSLPNPRA
jgi:hypothetical protein